MTVATAVSFLTPRAAYLAVLAVLPLAALALATLRVEHARRVLRLPSAPRLGRGRRAVLLTLFVLLLVVAAMQPVVRTTTSLRARTDAEVFVVLDTSRSMVAAPSPGGKTRLAAAKRLALALALRLHGIPLGVATFTDRVLPDVFPTSDRRVFDSTVEAVRIEDPPPRDSNTVATSFDALAGLATEGFFSPSAHRRAVVVLTDGESRPFDPAQLAATLREHGVQLAVARVGGAADRVWRADGTPEANFRPDPSLGRVSVARLAAAVDGAGDPASVVLRTVGSGPTSRVGVEPHATTLAPLAALLAALLLAAILGGVSPKSLRGVPFSRHAGDPRGART